MGVAKPIDVTAPQRKSIHSLLNKFLPNTRVWAFGSRVKFTSRPTSDLDLVAFIKPEQGDKLSELKDAFEESDLPFKVDLHDWNAMPDKFKQNIKKEYIVLQDADDKKEQTPKEWKTFDNKIELNLQMNQTLEAMAQAIFKEWFVEFKINGEKLKIDSGTGLPKGWKKIPIDESIEFLNGLALQKFPVTNGDAFLPVIKIRELRQGITDSSDKANTDLPQQYIIHDGDVLFSWSGSLEVVIWCDGKGALNQHLFKVSSDKFPKWFYFFWTRYYLPSFQATAEGKATTMGHIQRRHLTESLINVPPAEILKKADEILSPLLEKYIETKIENRSLIQLRDTLLPQLIPDYALEKIKGYSKTFE